MAKNNFNITEIFYSIQGEGPYQGIPHIFIRFNGCNLNCIYCDSKYSNKKINNKKLSLNLILQKIKKYNTKYILLTGGEPLIQKNIPILIKELIAKKYIVSIETNGSIDISFLNIKKNIIFDYKLTGSNAGGSFNQKNIIFLQESRNYLKFIISNKNDFFESLEFIKNNKLKSKNIIFSVNKSKEFNEKTLANLILNNYTSKMHYKIQIQIHKYIGFK